MDILGRGRSSNFLLRRRLLVRVVVFGREKLGEPAGYGGAKLPNTGQQLFGEYQRWRQMFGEKNTRTCSGRELDTPRTSCARQELFTSQHYHT